ncbi:MAG: general secretion pathway protein B [Candidatus Azotimanducaceae bacterium]|jgi:general secretion pathway protein B
MSYILDALKKSENERQSQDLPDINAVHERPHLQSVNKQKKWPIILIVILILNVAGFWFVWQRTPPMNETSAKTPEVSTILEDSVFKDTTETGHVSQQKLPDIIVTPLGVQNGAREILITPQDAYRKSPSTSSAPYQVQDSEQDLINKPLAADRPVKRITALPTNIQRQIPDLKFSSHLYADDDSFRMVNINGNMFHEGDYIAEGIRLERISEEGVVLAYLHYTFEISVIRDWSFQ